MSRIRKMTQALKTLCIRVFFFFIKTVIVKIINTYTYFVKKVAKNIKMIKKNMNKILKIKLMPNIQTKLVELIYFYK